MNRIILTFILSILIINTGFSQSLKGIIRDGEGSPVPFATVYISELKKGTTANIKGEYLILLEPGTYTVFFQSLGFSPTMKTVNITGGEKKLDIRLQIQFYVIPEVRVTSTGEDPAYAIMRKAIGLAPYYLNQVNEYSAEVYLKGSFIIRRLPKMILRRMEVNEEQIKTNEAYFIESLNEIDFTAPNKYIQRVISQQSTLPDAGNTDISPMDVIKASFYEPLIADIAISPLAPNAMSHYNFRYEGSTPQGNYVINKISVIPKRKSQQVFSGTLYIIEGLWCIHSLELKNENIAGSINITQLYTPVEQDIWMPVSLKFDVEVSIVGVRGDGEYGSAITYNSVVPNLLLEKPDAIIAPESRMYIAEEEAMERTKEQEKIDEILKKEELSNRDMARLSRLMDREAQKSNPESRELEVKSNTTFTVDEEAGNRDSTYWNKIRPIPLSDEELKSIRSADSLRALRSSKLAGTGERKNDTSATRNDRSFIRTLNDITFGKTFSNEDASLRFTYGGLFNPDRIGFNSVDGLYYGTDMRLWKMWEDGTAIIINPSAEWAFSRQDMNRRISGSFHYNRMKMNRFFFWFGDETVDYNRLTGISPALNLFTSLFFKENYLKLYRSKYATVAHRNEIVNGLSIEFRYNYEHRIPIDNSTNFSFLEKDKDYSYNLPSNPHLAAPAPLPDYMNTEGVKDHFSHSGEVKLIYVPRQRYQIQNNAKYALGSDYPTFSLDYRYGVNILNDGSQSPFSRIKFGVSKQESIGAFSEYSWSVDIGGFTNNKGAQFQDYFHFNSQPVPVQLTNYREVFMLPAYYSMATPDYFIEAHGRFTTPYMLLKLLPFLSNSLMRENISLAYLYTPTSGSYTELGYVLSEVFLLGRIGVFVGFNDLKYSSSGFRFTFIFN
ncbi:MAG: DUF5686 and carboxypeptidase regulatory-like domain-containing protein [Marinilabiliaceae bacterium]|jgi:hypothetical protein|nr:DUF5686 and carboxypeptidase regulatory-like domain-containing protein [Marinilabiliaceae bacterium]